MIIKLKTIELTALLKGIIVWFLCQMLILGLFTITVMNTEKYYGSSAVCQYHIMSLPCWSLAS